MFGDNDRPGVMLASAAQSYLNRYAVAIGRRIVVATNNDAAWYSAADLARGGAEVTVVDQRLKIDATLRQLAEQSRLSVVTGTVVTRALGRRQVVGVRTAALEAARERTPRLRSALHVRRLVRRRTPDLAQWREAGLSRRHRFFRAGRVGRGPIRRRRGHGFISVVRDDRRRRAGGIERGTCMRGSRRRRLPDVAMRIYRT